ncbi:MAG: hydrogen peroxide-dependent heme synthase [Candidatus Binatia bacterium]
MPGEKENEPVNPGDGVLPLVPLTLEGSCVLHQMFRVRWTAWNALDSAAKRESVEEATALLERMEQSDREQSAIFSTLGHKADLMILHFRNTMDALNDTEMRLSNLKLAEFLEVTTSYLSVVELGLYQFSISLFGRLKEKGVQPGCAEWTQSVEAELVKQREAAAPRLWPEIPSRRYLSFYPMNKMRGETKNWYQVPITGRRRMMREHGMIGRKYAGQVTQIISGSIGFDDWEWGVDLFADDPLVFKKLVYEMRFDDASAIYGLFGSFYLGLRFPAVKLATLLEGRLPSL